jgi:hypothetical protein
MRAHWGLPLLAAASALASPIAWRTSFARRPSSTFAWSTIANIFAAGDSYSTFFDAGHTLNFTALAQMPTNLVGRLRIRGHC